MRKKLLGIRPKLSIEARVQSVLSFGFFCEARAFRKNAVSTEKGISWPSGE
jgi:hypothetical protein